MGPQTQLFVFATTDEGTSAALRHAVTLAGGSRAGVVVLVPCVVGYGSPLDGLTARAEVEALTAKYTALAKTAGLNAAVRCACTREARHLPGRLLLGPSRIIVGGRQRGWRATPEQQLARDLSCEGHDVIFVDAQSGQAVDRSAPAHA